MKTWSYGINVLYKIGTIDVVEAPWYVLLVEWFADHACSYIPPIPFPNIWKRKRDADDDFHMYTLKEWYGDLRQMWCCYVDGSLFQWSYQHPKRKTYSFNVGYDIVKSTFYETNKRTFDEHEELLKETNGT